jgi:hypothetical protein
VTLTGNFRGPSDDSLTRDSSSFSASVSWSHAITDRLSSVFAVDDILGPTESRTRTISDTALTRTANWSDGPRVKLSLTFSLGRPGQPEPRTPATPSVPIPGGQ